MNQSQKKRTSKVTLRARPYRPHLEPCEDRWLPGDALLSGLLAQALFQVPPLLMHIRPEVSRRSATATIN